MRMILGWVLVLLGLGGCAAPTETSPAAAEPGPVILVSIDGFRADYLERGRTPAIAALAATGIRSEGMRPSFPSLTFPNHYTLVTGLVPDHHGIVANRMENPDFDTSPFYMSKFAAVSDARWWNQAVPIWVSAENAGMRTATMFWPGSEAPIRGVLPGSWRKFDKKVTPDMRVDQILAWLDLPAAERPRFLTLYFDAVDHEAHDHGPDSPQVDAALVQTDAAIARLRDGLAARGLLDRTDLVIVADHGMAKIQRTVLLESFLPIRRVKLVWSGATAGFSAVPGAEREVARALKKAPPQVHCWPKPQIPQRLHYGTNARIPQFLCLADPGTVLRSKTDPEFNPKKIQLGQHGYDPADPRMAALFVARGPDFKQGVVLPAFDNVDVYPLVMRLLGLRPEPNDGTLTPFLPALRSLGAG